ncbi:hypothetical protein ACFLXQ_06905 [Chloroflexota bacterium]
MVTTIHPQWIAKMYPGKVGRDHLGLGSVSSDQILPSLSPSINVLTYHPRYHSFYVFLLDEFWRRDRPRSEEAWTKFYRPREFIFSVGANLCEQPEHGDIGKIVGAQKTYALAQQKQTHYDTSFNYIKSRLGGYGLYYRTVMAEVGLIYLGGRGYRSPVDIPGELGKEVAAAFRQAIQHTTYYQNFFDDDATQVPFDVVREYIKPACLCQLQVTGAPDRALLLDIFLHHGHHVEARRATFRLFLDIVAQTQGYALDQDMFRQLLYFRAAENGATYQPQEAVLDTYQRWRLYQGREYYAFALNTLWYYLCEWGVAQSGDMRPISFSVIWQYLEAALNFDPLAEWLEVPASGLGADSNFPQLLDWLQRLVGASQAMSFDAACRLDSPINEDSLYGLVWDEDASPEMKIAGMITMLGLIYLRFSQSDLQSQPVWQVSRMGADGRLSVDGFVRRMKRNLAERGSTIAEVARWLYRDFIILQHQLIATSKLPDNTFRFRWEGDRLRFYRFSNSLSFMDSRFEAISTTIHELGLGNDFRYADHPLTPDGEALLATGDLPYEPS